MKRFGDSVSFGSPEIESAFERFFYRISIKSVRATLLLCLSLYVILYFAVLPLTHPIDQPQFWPVFLVVFSIMACLYGATFTPLYLNNPKLGNTLIAITTTTSISLAMFAIESLSPTLLHVTSLTMIASSVAFGMQWVRSVIVTVSYFCLNLYLVAQSSIPFADYMLGIFNLFGFMMVGIITGYMVSLLQINSFILKANGEALIKTLQSNEAKYRELSLRDGLTQLFNRRHFDETGQRKAAEAKRYSSQLHLLILDIDHFKEYNDTYGHPEGDAALLSVSLLLKKTFRRPSDLIFRIGGEEFAVITVDDIAENINLYTKEIHNNIERENIPHTTNQVANHLTVSIGMATLNTNDDTNFADLYHRADKALYHAKHSGRNQTVVY
jgi:diguanylate cyclase (GGDEF)-like protein